MAAGDEIIGVAILTDGLLYFCHWSPTFQGGFVDYSSIPIAEEKAADARNPWRYRKNGERLDCWPSVKMFGGRAGTNEFFHNGYNWSVRFVEIPDGAPNVLDQLIELNREIAAQKRALCVKPA